MDTTNEEWEERRMDITRLDSIFSYDHLPVSGETTISFSEVVENGKIEWIRVSCKYHMEREEGGDDMDAAMEGNYSLSVPTTFDHVKALLKKACLFGFIDVILDAVDDDQIELPGLEYNVQDDKIQEFVDRINLSAGNRICKSIRLLA